MTPALHSIKGKIMKYTDAMILETHAKIASEMAEDPFLAVCLALLGYGPADIILHDDHEYRNFEARYNQLITPAVTAEAGIPRALKAARIALENEEIAVAAKDRSLDQLVLLQDIVNVLEGLTMPKEKPGQGSSTNQG